MGVGNVGDFDKTFLSVFTGECRRQAPHRLRPLTHPPKKMTGHVSVGKSKVRYYCSSEFYPTTIIRHAYLLERLTCVFGTNPELFGIDKLFKALILFTIRAA